LRSGKLTRNDIVMTTRGTVGNFAYYNDLIGYADIRINSGMFIIRTVSSIVDPIFNFCLMRSDYFKCLIVFKHLEALNHNCRYEILCKLSCVIHQKKK